MNIFQAIIFSTDLIYQRYIIDSKDSFLYNFQMHNIYFLRHQSYHALRVLNTYGQPCTTQFSIPFQYGIAQLFLLWAK